MNGFFRLIRDENGATAIEYAMIAMLIALVVVVAIQRIGTSVTNSFNNVANGFSR